MERMLISPSRPKSGKLEPRLNSWPESKQEKGSIGGVELMKVESVRPGSTSGSEEGECKSALFSFLFGKDSETHDVNMGEPVVEGALTAEIGEPFMVGRLWQKQGFAWEDEIEEETTTAPEGRVALNERSNGGEKYLLTSSQESPTRQHRMERKSKNKDSGSEASQSDILLVIDALLKNSIRLHGRVHSNCGPLIVKMLRKIEEPARAELIAKLPNNVLAISQVDRLVQQGVARKKAADNSLETNTIQTTEEEAGVADVGFYSKELNETCESEHVVEGKIADAMQQEKSKEMELKGGRDAEKADIRDPYLVKRELSTVATCVSDADEVKGKQQEKGQSPAKKKETDAVQSRRQTPRISYAAAMLGSI